MSKIREDALTIIRESIHEMMPAEAVSRALLGRTFHGDVVLVAIGKAAWSMASTAVQVLGARVRRGVVLTKYGHSRGTIPACEIIEAGHPLPDENSELGAGKILEMVSELQKGDQVIFLVSGGGSALFEKPFEGLSLAETGRITAQLLRCGADITEINTIRKHLSAVKGGRFAQKCGEAAIYAILLSDVVGDRLDVIASGPAYPDGSTSADALRIVRKYQLEMSEAAMRALQQETPKSVTNCETVVIGSVAALCEAAAQSAARLGYEPVLLTTSLEMEAREAGKFFAAIGRELRRHARTASGPRPPCAIIAGGETIVHLKGNGLGGRNQELVLSAALGIEGIEETIICSVGSDGGDGPTDAAGGIVDGTTAGRLRGLFLSPEDFLEDNNAYSALKASGDLIITGPTGTNVNDLTMLLSR